MTDLDLRSLPYLATLNEPQFEAATHVMGPLIVLAGAGSGKTKMLTARMAHLIGRVRVPPYQVLAVTFTNKAAAEMRERVQHQLAADAHLGSPEIGTFHSVCVRLLRREAAYTPFTAPFVIYDDSDQLSLIKTVVSALGIDDKAFSPKAFQGAINRAKCDALEASDIVVEPHNLFQKNLIRVYEEYQKRMEASNALDFGEIITLTYRILRDNETLRQKIQRRFQFIHVDEYQDTNRAQYLLLSQLASPKFGGHQNLCVVGDEDQSIYKWRGADINNILDFETEYPEAHVVKLEQNYRSTQNVIEAAGQVIRNNKHRKDKTLWTQNPTGDKIIRVKLPDERAEAEMVVSEVKSIARDQGRSFKEFAIFYRTHAQSRQFEDVLRREKVPYEIYGGLRFYDRKEIKDVLCYFRALLNPADSVSLKRIINTPARGIGKTSLDKVEAYWERRQLESVEAFTYWDALREVGEQKSELGASAARKIHAFVNLMDQLRAEQKTKRLSELYHLLLDQTGYVRTLKDEGTEESAARIENLEEFDNLLQEFEEDFFGADLEAQDRLAELLPTFLENATLASDADTKAQRGQSEEQGPVLRMMTLHSSKGLEYPVVFMVGMEEGLFPSIRQWQEADEEDLEEERRLCYVGMTRARERLYMSFVVVRRIWGETHYQEPARFFDEFDERLVEDRDFTASRQTSGPPIASLRVIPQMGSHADDLKVVGSWIDHPEYGKGKIVASEGVGESRKVTIEFGIRTQKKFLYRFIQPLLAD